MVGAKVVSCHSKETPSFIAAWRYETPGLDSGEVNISFQGEIVNRRSAARARASVIDLRKHVQSLQFDLLHASDPVLRASIQAEIEKDISEIRSIQDELMKAASPVGTPITLSLKVN